MNKWYDNEITQGILKKKYLQDDESTFSDLVHRLGSIFDSDIRDKVETAMFNADLCPAGRTLAGAGLKGKKKVTLSNCFIITTPEDSLEAISASDLEMSIIGSRGGGVGVSLDKIRPKGTPINNSARVSDGVEFVLKKYNQTGESIGQYTRRMAMMVALSCSHPDIYEFLNIKQKNEKLSAMNISIKFTDEFMQAVKDNATYELYFKIEPTGEEIRRTINAREFFDEFCEVNKDYADPGCIFIDRVQKYNLLSGYPEYQIDVSNPCAEFFGNAGNSCNLGSINLYNVVDNKFTDDSAIDYTKLASLVRLSINMLNQTLDYGYSMQPLDINRKCIDDWRSIGLGVFGLADMFIALGIKYGSKEALELTSDLFEFINVIALDESAELAKKHGTFGKYDWDKTSKSPFIESLKGNDYSLYYKIHKYGLRNGTLLSIAPTGSLSLFMGGFSGGCEPLFKVSYDRTTHSTENDKKHFKVYARSVNDLLEHNKLSKDLSTDEIKKRFPFIVESHEIKPIDRVAMQSVMQDYVDNAISSTVNLPEGTPASVIKDIYISAWEQGLKGITVYVDNCKRGNILGFTGDKKDKEVTEPVYDKITPVKRRDKKEVSGSTYLFSSACAEQIYATVNKTDDGDIFEVFVNASGGCQSNVSTITRLVSSMLRSGIKVSKIIEELSTAKCPACQALRNKGNKNVSLSCGNAIASALKKAYNNGAKEIVVKDEVTSCSKCETPCKADDSLMECPDCKEKTLRREAHCVTCDNCGYSKCD